MRLEATGTSNGSPRSVAFNVQAFEIAVHRRYGTLRILRSLHAADAGTVMNPMQCRGQVEGGVAQAIGAALYEELRVDDAGRVTNPVFRGYHIPAFADVPHTEVWFADTYDTRRPARRQVDERKPLQSGGGRARQRHPRRNGIAIVRNAVRGRPAVQDHHRSRRRSLECKTAEVTTPFSTAAGDAPAA